MGRKGASLLNLLEVTLGRGGGICDNRWRCNNGCPPLCISVIRSSNEQSSCRQAALEIHVQVPAPGQGLGLGSCYYAKSWNWQNQLQLLSLPLDTCKPSIDFRVSNKLCQTDSLVRQIPGVSYSDSKNIAVWEMIWRMSRSEYWGHLGEKSSR